MRALAKTLGVASLCLLAGCASTPDVEVTYYLPQAALQTTVIRTINCDAQDNVVMVSTVIAKVIYSRNETESRTVRIRDADSQWANTEMTFTLLEDGRLAGLNATQAGQGPEILKSAFALAGAVMAAADGNAGIVTTECNFVRSINKEKGLTLTFIDTEIFGQDVVAKRVIDPIPESGAYYEKVRNIMGKVCIEGTKRTLNPKVTRAKYHGNFNSAVKIGLIDPAVFDMHVKQDGDSSCIDPIFSLSPLVPQRGDKFDLPVPKPQAFGKQVFAVTLAESGAITMLKYGKDTGAAGVLNAVADATGTATTTNSEKFLELKAEADIIAQQQRLVRCRTTPTSCT
jgi:hypothetical protein